MKSLRTIIGIAITLALLLGPAAAAYGQAPLPLDPDKALTQYRHTSWSADDGLPQNRINAIAQSRDGYLWLGTQEGLVRFDGIEFQVFDKQNTPLASSNVAVLMATTDGGLWIGTRGGGASYYRDGTFTNFTAEDGLNSDHVSAFAEEASGGIWIATTTDGLNHVAPDGTITNFRAEDGLGSDAINTLLADESGNLWVGTRDAGLVRFHDGRFSSFASLAGMPSAEIAALFEDRHGALWIAPGDGGLIRLSGGKLRQFTTADGLPEGELRSIFEDSNGLLWVGTEAGGVARLRDDRFETFSSADGLTGDDVLSLAEDAEGNLWIGTRTGGLNQLQNGKFTTLTSREGLPSNLVYAIHQAPNGDVWMGTDGAGVVRLHGGSVTSYTTEDGLAGNRISTLLAGRDGSVWVGTQNNGLSRWRNGRITTFTEEDGLPDLGVYALHEDADGVLWFGSDRHGLVRYDGRRFTALTADDGLSSNYVTTIIEGGDGRLWVGTYTGGLNEVIDGRVAARYDAADGLRNNYVVSLHEDDRGTLWIGTSGGGLVRLRNDSLSAVTQEQGLHSDKISQILQDTEGHLWLSSNRGLSRLDRAVLDAVADGRRPQVLSEVFDKSDGLRTNEFNGGRQPSGWEMQDGRLWFASNEGALIVDPGDIPRNTLPPPVVVEQMTAGEDTVGLRGNITLAPGRDKLAFRYVGLSFVAPEKVEYRYMLEGVDDDWVDAGTRREAFYTNLSPGRYTFRVLARNSDGVWSDEAATVSFYLKPFFWQTRWFYFLVALGLAAAGLGLYRLRVRQLKARQRELEALVLARTKDLREEKEKTEQAKNVIEEQAEQLRELDKMKTRFFSNISHEFRTPLTLNIGPMENALSGLYGPLSAPMRKQVEIMLRNSRRLLRLINQLLDLSKLETGRMTASVRRQNLVPFVEGIVHSFSGFAEKNDINLEFSSDADAHALYVDGEKIEKVVFNLLSNAIKFTPEGGTIAVSMAGTTVDTDDGAREAVTLRVRDTGCGIPETALPNIFDRFQQVEGSVSKVQEGTGIGLALVKELVELHRGRIDVESVEDEGTTFIITLFKGKEHFDGTGFVDESEHEDELPEQTPSLTMEVLEYEDDEDEEDLDEFEPVAAPAAGDAPPSVNGTFDPVEATRGALVLVVDDNPDVRNYVASSLKLKYKVRTAKNGQEALEKARKIRPDLIVSDVMMPIMTGVELVRAVRADEAIQRTPFILLTSKASQDDKNEGLQAGADDYLTKPFNAEELFLRVRNLLFLAAHQRMLERTNGMLRDAVEMKSQVLRIAAHDLKNPLNNIREFSKIITEEVGEDAYATELLGLIEKSSNQMLQMISQMLEAEALESGELEIKRKPMQLRELAAAVVEQNRMQARAKSQEIVFEADADTLVEASEEWLQEGIDNLVSNAIKYSPADKRIWVEVRRLDDAVRFSVRDEGPGLTDEDKEKLFRKFQKLSARPTGGESSTGLGLSIVKKIVEMHDGDVGVESVEGEGATFYIEIEALADDEVMAA